MAFSTCAMVAALIPNLLNGASTLDNMEDGLRPASSEIRQFMSGGCSLIVANLASLGFNPPAEGGALYDFLGDIEANYAAWRAELSRSSPRVAKGERSRADDFRKAYEANLRQLHKMDLSMMGFTPKFSTGTGWYVGGTSQAEKDSVASNTDRVPARFERNSFGNPELPGDTVGSE
jgi:hypothetical protein